MLHENINQFFQISRKYIITYLGISVTIFLFVLFFQPFTPALFEFENKLLFLAGLGIIPLAFLFLSQLIFQKFLVKNEDNIIDNSFISMIYYLCLISFNTVSYVFYLRYVGRLPMTFTLVIRSLMISVGIASSIHLIKSLAFLKREVKELMDENRNKNEMLKQYSEGYSNKYIELTSEHDPGIFRIHISDLLFIKAADNYIEIVYMEAEATKKRMLRNTLKNAEKQLKEYNNFIRTHRSCIVNIDSIEKLHRSFNTYWLSLLNSKETIPVSRHYLLAVKELLQ